MAKGLAKTLNTVDTVPGAANPFVEKWTKAQRKTVEDWKNDISALEQIDDILTTNWISVENNDYKAAINKLIEFNIQIATDPAVNGGSVLLNPEEIKVIKRLFDGYLVGPDAKKVLDKLEGKK